MSIMVIIGIYSSVRKIVKFVRTHFGISSVGRVDHKGLAIIMKQEMRKKIVSIGRSEKQ